MKAAVVPLALLIITSLAAAENEPGYIRQRQMAEEPATSSSARVAPYVVGDHLSTMIDESENSAIPGESSHDGSSLKYEVMFREGASYTAVHFKDFALGEGCTMVVSGKDLPDGTPQVPYKMTGRGKLDQYKELNDGFWAQHVKGDTMTIEIRCSKNTLAKESMHFEIDEVAVGFVSEEDGPAKEDPFGESTCGTNDDENAICRTGTTQYQRARAVARLLISGSSLCTGWLVNGNGHLITNDHCISSSTSAANTDFDFGAEAPFCGTANCQQCFPGTIFSGATFIQSSAALDYALLQFTATSPQSSFGFLEIDDRAAALNEQIYIPQHPAGYAKVFGITSTHSQNSPDNLCRIDSTSEPGCTGFQSEYGYFCDTQGGSSGSPVLAFSSNKVIALHHCRGDTACTQTGGDPNRGVPIQLINAQIGSIIGTPSTPTTPPPTPVPTPAPTISCSSSQKVFTLDLTTDRFGGETTWTLVNSCTGTTILSNGPYASGSVTKYIENYCLTDGQQYTFTILDSFGDGLCCVYGAGAYSVYYDGTLQKSGGTFAFSETHAFGAACDNTPSPSTTQAPTGPPTFCFSDKATVPVQNQGPINMPNLAHGDKVLTANGYHTLFALGHQDSNIQTKFLQIYTRENNKPLEITNQHLLFVVGKPHPVAAHSIRTGDVLQSMQRLDGAVVTKIASIHRSGLYAPITADGTLVVDGIVTSCYVALQNNNHHEYVELSGGISIGMSQHFFAHLAMTPVRMACLGISAELCKSFDKDGLAHFAKIGFAVANWADSLSLPLQMVLLPMYLFSIGSLYTLEAVCGPRMALLVVIGMVAAAARRILPRRKTKTL